VIHRYKYQRAIMVRAVPGGNCSLAAAGPRTWRGKKMGPHRAHSFISRQNNAKREFNQARAVGARGSATRRASPSMPGLLKRVLPTRTQTQLSRAERLVNMRRGFSRWPKAEKLTGERVVLVDDVFLRPERPPARARRSCGRAGRGEVCVWTVARGKPEY